MPQSAKLTTRSTIQSLWWIWLLRGILLIVLGIYALVSPGTTVAAFVIVAAAYAVVDGILLIVTGISARDSDKGWGWIVAQGVLTTIAGLIVLTLPGLFGMLAVFGFLWFQVIGAGVGGVLGIIAAARSTASGKGWAITSGVFSVLFALALLVLLVLTPQSLALALIWTVGVVAVLLGIGFVITAVQVRKGSVQLAEAIDDVFGIDEDNVADRRDGADGAPRSN